MKNYMRFVVILMLCLACSGVGLGHIPTPTATLEAAATPVASDSPEMDTATTRPPTPLASPTATQPLPTATLGTPSPTPPPTPTLEPVRPLRVDVDYDTVIGGLDTARLRNGAVGGFAPLSNYLWLAGALDDLAAIDMEMIRVDHITDDAFYQAVWRDGGGELRFDFSRLNRAVVPIFQAGMQPLLCLSYKPKVLEPEGSASQPPADLEEWEKVVQAYAAHFAAMGYTGLHWEVWNEPDLGFFFQGSPQQYIDLYVSTARALKAVDPTARVGGAADSSVTSPGGKLTHLLAYIGDHPEVPLDFVSYHDYGDPDGDGLPPYKLDWNVGAVEVLLEEYDLGPRDIFVTEWNLTPSMTTGPGAPSDTNQGAAAAAVRFYYLFNDPAIKRAFFFSPIEGFTPDRIFNGDLGLLTVNYHRKAIYNLFEMLTFLGNERLGARVEGNNAESAASYALATRDSGTDATAVLVWNYWDVGRTVDLNIGNLPYAAQGQNVEGTRYIIDAEHANYYRDYSAGLRGYPVGPTERLLPVESRVIAPADRYATRVAMAPYSVMLVVLSPTALDPVPGPIKTPPPALPYNYAAAQSVTAGATLDGWQARDLVDEITHSLPDSLGWSSEIVGDAGTEMWVQIDLGSAVTVDTVRLYPRDDAGHEGDGFPVDFILRGSADGETWVDLVSATGYDPGEPAYQAQTFTFAPGAYRYVRLVATRLGAISDGGYALQLAEMAVTGKGVLLPE